MAFTPKNDVMQADTAEAILKLFGDETRGVPKNFRDISAFAPTNAREVDVDGKSVPVFSSSVVNTNLSGGTTLGSASSLVETQVPSVSSIISEANKRAASVNTDNPIVNRVSSLVGLKDLTTVSVEPADILKIGNYVQQASKSKTDVKTFAPNVLDDYENVTYGIKLCLAPEAQLISATTNPTGPFYIVAQTGVTTNFFIKSLEIQAIVSPTVKTRTVSSTIMQMVIAEPQGLSFMDKLFAAGRELGIKDITHTSMILEITFKGYTKDGTATEVEIGRRTFRVVLNKIDTKLDVGGTEYHIELQKTFDYAFNRFSAAAQIQQQATIQLSTVGQFFDDLGYILTLQAASIAIQGQVARSEYVFKVNPEMRAWRIGDSPETKNNPSVFVESNGKKQMVISTDMTLDRIVDLILASTKEGNLMINPSSSSSEKLDKSPQTKVPQIARIDGNVENIGFNEVANDYIRKYTYYINKSDSFRAVIDKPEYTNQDSRISYMLQDSLKKKYEYIFTGRNTDVLDLDISLNTLWSHASAYYASGIQRKNNTSSKFISRVPETITQDDLRDKQTINNFKPNTKSQDIGTKDSTNDKAKSDEKKDKEAKEALKDVKNSLDKLSKNSVQSAEQLKAVIAKEDALQGVIPIEGTTNSRDLTSISEGFRLNTNPQNARYIEDFGNGQENTLAASSILNFYKKKVDPSIDTTRVSNNIEATTDYGRSVFGVITNQLYNQTTNDLSVINMSIRGDPFWIGENDIEHINRLESNSTFSPGGDESINYLKGDHCLFLVFKTPSRYNEETGFLDMRESDTFMGVYTVATVVHMFEGGKFTQKIEAIRDINTNAENLRKLIN